MAARPCDRCGGCGEIQQSSAMGYRNDSFPQALEQDGPAQPTFIRDPNDEEVMPIPIGNYSNGYDLDGSGFEPIAGFEHLAGGVDFSQHFVDATTVQQDKKPTNSTQGSENVQPVHMHCPDTSSVDPMRLDATCEPPTSNSTSVTTAEDKDRNANRRFSQPPVLRKLKRSRRPTPEPRPARKRKQLSIPPYGSASKPQAEKFHIGDLKSVKEFFKKRLQELTLAPLRSIATEWIKLAEPDRKRDWGPYSRVKPECDAEGEYPQWWPRHVRHLEPGHLKGDELAEVCIQLLLLHRYVDNNNNPRLGWTHELRKAAMYVVESIRIEKFAAGRPEYNEGMKKCASTIIIPDLLKVAQLYEEHVAPYKLWKNAAYDSLVPFGEEHIWTPCPRPKRGSRYTSVKWRETQKRRRETSPAVADSDSQSERDVKILPSRDSTPDYASTVCNSPMVMSAPSSFGEFSNPLSLPLQHNDFPNFSRPRTPSFTYIRVPIYHNMPHGLPNPSSFDVTSSQVSATSMPAPAPAMSATDLPMNYWSSQMERSQSYHPQFSGYQI